MHHASREWILSQKNAASQDILGTIEDLGMDSMTVALCQGYISQIW